MADLISLSQPVRSASVISPAESPCQNSRNAERENPRRLTCATVGEGADAHIHARGPMDYKSPPLEPDRQGHARPRKCRIAAGDWCRSRMDSSVPQSAVSSRGRAAAISRSVWKKCARGGNRQPVRFSIAAGSAQEEASDLRTRRNCPGHLFDQCPGSPATTLAINCSTPGDGGVKLFSRRCAFLKGSGRSRMSILPVAVIGTSFNATNIDGIM